MRCTYCGTSITSFAAARLITVGGEKVVACRDIDACNARRAGVEPSIWMAMSDDARAKALLRNARE